MNEGFVQLPIEKYNELLLENLKLKAAITIRKDWSDKQAKVEFSLPLLKDVITEKFNQSSFKTAGFQLRKFDEFYNPSATIADLPDPEDDNETE